MDAPVSRGRNRLAFAGRPIFFLRMETSALAAADGHRIPLREWPAGEAPRLVVQLAHGMGEHALRYARLAQALNARGIAVVANEHRGHGPAAQVEATRGEFGAGGFDALVADMALVTDHIARKHPGVPIVLLGHSMGSFAAQLYAVAHAQRLAGLVLSGTAATDLLMNPNGPQRKLEDYAGSAPTRTPFDWLSRDEAEVDKYVADPLCGFTISKASRATMVEACKRTAAPGAWSALPSALPVYLMTGDQDPVNNRLAWFHPLVERMRAAGLRDVTVKIYPGARHELFNETNRDEVTADLVGWLEKLARGA
jgi:alpha-beta hydrolase superfamily lysophospholipase